jgi:hypothetical protein
VGTHTQLSKLQRPRAHVDTCPPLEWAWIVRSRTTIRMQLLVPAVLASIMGCARPPMAVPPLPILLSYDAYAPQPTLSPADRGFVRATAERGAAVSIFVDAWLASSVDLAPWRRACEVEHGPRRSVLISEHVAGLEAARWARTRSSSRGSAGPWFRCHRIAAFCQRRHPGRPLPSTTRHAYLEVAAAVADGFTAEPSEESTDAASNEKGPSTAVTGGLARATL